MLAANLYQQQKSACLSRALLLRHGRLRGLACHGVSARHSPTNSVSGADEPQLPTISTASEWDAFVEQLSGECVVLFDDDASEKCLYPELGHAAARLASLDATQLSTVHEESFLSFLQAIPASSGLLSPLTIHHVADAVNRSQHFQGLVRDRKEVREAACAAVRAVTDACEEAFWHPDLAAAAVRLQLAFHLGHRRFWNLLAVELPAVAAEFEPGAVSDVLRTAAALTIRDHRFWMPMATAADAMCLQMTPQELDVALRALVATRAVEGGSMGVDGGQNSETPEQRSAAVKHMSPRLHTLQEVVQWRCETCGCWGPRDDGFPAVAVACAALLPARSDFWNALTDVSSRQQHHYTRLGAATVAAAAWSAGRKLATSAQYGEAGVMENVDDTLRKLQSHVRELLDVCMRSGVAAAGGEGARGSGGDVMAKEFSEVAPVLLSAACEVALPREVYGHMLQMVQSRVRRGLARGAELVAVVLVTARSAQQAAGVAPDDKERLVEALEGAAKQGESLDSRHAVALLSAAQLLPEGLVAAVLQNNVLVASWLLNQTISGGLHSLREGELAALLRALVVARVPLDSTTELVEFRADLKSALERATYRPRHRYGGNELGEGGKGGSDDDDEGEREQRMWRVQHGRNASGFSASEAADAALAAKTLGLFEGGSTQLEALLAVSMGGGHGTRGAERRSANAVEDALEHLVAERAQQLLGASAEWLAEGAEARAESRGGLDITRQRTPVFSASLAAGGAVMTEREEAGLQWVEEGGGGYDGSAAAAVAEVLERSGGDVRACMRALEATEWNVQEAVDAVMAEVEAGRDAGSGGDAEVGPVQEWKV